MTWAGVVQTIISALVPLVSVALGGWLTLRGSQAVQMRQIAAEKLRLRADKHEELVTALYEHSSWLQRLRTHDVFGQGQPAEGISPTIAKIDAIAAIYFPATLPEIQQFVAASNEYELWIAKAEGKRLSGQTSNLNEGFDEVIKKYLKAFDAVLTALRTEGVKLDKPAG